MEKIIFASNEHKDFYMSHLQKCRRQDVYHAALVYCLGIDRDTREHAEQIYDFKTGLVKTECLHEGWQTSGSKKIVRMAFNLYCNGTPSTYEYEKAGGMWEIYGGGFILLWLCSVFLAGDQNSVSGILWRCIKTPVR